MTRTATSNTRPGRCVRDGADLTHNAGSERMITTERGDRFIRQSRAHECPGSEDRLSVGSDGVDRHYLIVSGPATSGKTLVARGLSDELGWPIFAKDTIKAALMSVLPVADVDDALRLGRAAVEVLLAVAAEVTGGAVLEAVWRRDQVMTVSSLPGAVVEVFCRCDRPTLEARYAARRRSAGYVPEHQDPRGAMES